MIVPGWKCHDDCEGCRGGRYHRQKRDAPQITNVARERDDVDGAPWFITAATALDPDTGAELTWSAAGHPSTQGAWQLMKENTKETT